MKVNSIDIFCEIIDNFGDIGVVYRISKELKKIFQNVRIRIVLNRLEEFKAINKKVKDVDYQEIEDIGVVYRISKELKKIFQNVRIRIVLNRLEEFKAINKKVKDVDYQEIDGLICVTEKYVKENMESFGVSDVFIEAFGCNVPEEYVKAAKENSKLWINLEYLSGEKWIEDFHLCESLIDSKTLKKIFFMPGFSEKSGGVIIDSGFLERMKYGKENRDEVFKKYFKDFDLKDKFIGTVFSYEKNFGVIIDSGFLERMKYGKENRDEVFKKYFKDFDLKDKFIGTVFSYEKNFENLLETLKNYEKETVLLLMGEKTQKSFSEILKKNLTEDYGNIVKYGKITMIYSDFFSQEEYEEIISASDFNFTRGEDSFVRGTEDYGNIVKYGKITMIYSDFFSQEEYEEIISASDFNFTRGEDSFVRGIILGKPFMWHIYLQEEKAHMDKIKAFTERFKESIKVSEEEKNIIESYCNLLEDYNDRDKNSLEKGKEDFRIFFEKFEEINRICEKYSKFLLEKCNLVKKLYKYIQEY